MIGGTSSVPEAGRREGLVWIPAGATLLNPRGRTMCLGRSIEPDLLLGDPSSSKGQEGPNRGDALGEAPLSQAGGIGGTQILPWRAAGWLLS